MFAFFLLSLPSLSWKQRLHKERHRSWFVNSILLPKFYAFLARWACRREEARPLLAHLDLRRVALHAFFPARRLVLWDRHIHQSDQYLPPAFGREKWINEKVDLSFLVNKKDILFNTVQTKWTSVIFNNLFYSLFVSTSCINKWQDCSLRLITYFSHVIMIANNDCIQIQFNLQHLVLPLILFSCFIMVN